MKRFICALLALTLCLSMVACGKKTEPAGTIKEGLCYEATGISPDATAVTAYGVDVPMDIYYYFMTEAALYMEDLFSYYGMSLDWEMEFSEAGTVADTVRAEAQLNAIQMAVIESLVKKHSVTLSEDLAREMDEQRAAAIEQVGGEEEYEAIIAKMGMRTESYERIIRAQYLQAALQELYLTEGSVLYVSDEELVPYAEEVGMMTADHILFGTLDNVTRQPLEESVIAERKAQAEETLAKLRAYDGDDLYGYFAELGAEFSTDQGRVLNPEGYTFGPGQMVTEFEEGTAALQVGEVSEIIESVYGYHIILRKELDTKLAAATVRPDYFLEIMEEMIFAAEPVENEKLGSIDVAAAYGAFLEAQGVTEEGAQAEGEAEQNGEVEQNEENAG